MYQKFNKANNNKSMIMDTKIKNSNNLSKLKVWH